MTDIHSSLEGRGRPKMTTTQSAGSVLNSGTKKTTKKSNGRSLSHNKLSKLSSSSTSVSASRPHLSRSKSTDGLTRSRSSGALKRNNRSFTKVVGLQPLTKTVSKGSNKSQTSLKGISGAPATGLKTSMRKGKAILSLNDDDGDYEDMEDAKTSYEDKGEEDKTDEEAKTRYEFSKEKSFEDSKRLSSQSSTVDFGNNMYGGSMLLSQSTGLVKKVEHKDDRDYGYGIPKNQSFLTDGPESLNGISFKANPIDGSIAEPVTTSKNVVPNNSYQPNQTIFNNLQRTNSQYLSSKRKTEVDDVNFSNFLTGKSQDSMEPHSPTNIKTRAQQRLWLQRENSLLDVSNMDPTKINFSNLSLNNLMFAHHYAKDAPSTPAAPQVSQSNLQQQLQNAAIENRTEPNSINGLFLMLQNNSSIQSRTEYERMNREYLNVRRNSNPVGETLSRIEKYFEAVGSVHGTGEIEVQKRKRTSSPAAVVAGNTFRDVAKLYTDRGEVNGMVNRLWQEAAGTIAAPQYRQNSQQQLQQQLQYQQRNRR